jgi:hypothetical protein
MRQCRWLVIGLNVYLLAGCMSVAVPADSHARRPNTPPDPVEIVSTQPTNYTASSDYAMVVATPKTAPVRTTAASVETTEDKRPEQVSASSETRNGPEEPSSPPQPADPQPRMELQAAPPPRSDAPPVQVLRALIEGLPEEEINEALKPYDQPTREAMLCLLNGVNRLHQSGGIGKMTPRDLAVWTEGLHTLTASLRSRAQLILDRMCFCAYIKNFGDFAPLPPEHAFFQPGEVAHIYVQVRNFSCRRERDRYVTVVKGRLEIYDENNRDKQAITWISSPRQDVSAAPRQDYYINFRFPVPIHCPSGLYTMRITVEDWTDAPPGAKEVPESRIARRTIDFRVGGPVVRPARAQIIEATPAP